MVIGVVGGGERKTFAGLKERKKERPHLKKQRMLVKMGFCWAAADAGAMPGEELL